MRYYRLESADGTLPADYPLQIGAIVRVRSTRSRLPGPVFNEQTCEWVIPSWRECDDPTASTS